MLTLEDCIEMSDLTPDEVEAIAEHEHTDLILAAELGAYLVHSEEGQVRIHRMILDDIAHAQRRGDSSHAAKLKLVLSHFVEEHGDLEHGDND